MARWTSESFHTDGDLFALDSFHFVGAINEDEWDDGLGSSGRAPDVARSYETDFDLGWAVHGGYGAASTLAFEAGSATVRGDRVEVIDGPLAAKGGNSGDKPGNGNGGGKDKDEDTGNDDSVLPSYRSSGEYNIEVIFEGTWTSELQQAFVDAADFLSTVIIADVQDVFFRGKIIDDITIDAELMDIDGVGGILGQAGPTVYRTADYLPAAGVMQFDIADAESLNQNSYWDDVVLHEMIHTLGFGTMWDAMGLITVIDDEYRFTGEQAIATYNTEFADIAGGDDNSHLGVPVETDQGGEGTIGGHWDEATFDRELMTGFLDVGEGVENYLSDMSIAALDDMGYDTMLFADDQIA